MNITIVETPEDLEALGSSRSSNNPIPLSMWLGLFNNDYSGFTYPRVIKNTKTGTDNRITPPAAILKKAKEASLKVRTEVIADRSKFKVYLEPVV